MSVGLARSLLEGLIGVGELNSKTIARQVGKGIRRSAAPVGAAGGTAVLMKGKNKDTPSDSHEKKAFWHGFEKRAITMKLDPQSAERLKDIFGSGAADLKEALKGFNIKHTLDPESLKKIQEMFAAAKPKPGGWRRAILPMAVGAAGVGAGVGAGYAFGKKTMNKVMPESADKKK